MVELSFASRPVQKLTYFERNKKKSITQEVYGGKIMKNL
jgi:hypothetical protein